MGGEGMVLSAGAKSGRNGLGTKIGGIGGGDGGLGGRFGIKGGLGGGPSIQVTRRYNLLWYNTAMEMVQQSRPSVRLGQFYWTHRIQPAMAHHHGFSPDWRVNSAHPNHDLGAASWAAVP
jgi:hypothetical protein